MPLGLLCVPPQETRAGRGFPSCLCLLLRSEPAETSPELGCVKAEDVPEASGTRPTMLGPGSAPAPLGSAQKFGSHAWGDPPSSCGCPQRRSIRSPHLKQQAILQGLHCPDRLTSLSSRQFPPARAHLQVLVWLPASSGEAGGEGQRAGASSWLCETTWLWGWGDSLWGQDDVATSAEGGLSSPAVGVPRRCQKP